MTKVLVIQGAGFNMRGRTQIELFGSETMEQINDKIRGYAATLEIEVETFHSNIEGEVANALYDAHDRDFDAAVINPAGFTTSASVLRNAINQVGFPVIEVHFTNPAVRGIQSSIHPVCKGSVYGFGVYGNYLALEAAKYLAEAR